MSGLGFPLGSPLGDAGEIFTAGPVDHVEVGKERLLEQFQGGAHPRIQALAAAPLVSSNRLEGVLWTLLTLTGLDNAEGAWLDEWGAILGLERDGEDDTRYRELLYARLYALRSCGTVEDVIRVMEALDATWEGGIDQLDDDPDLDPATFKLTWLTPALDDDLAERYRRFLQSARAAGIKVHFYSWPAIDDELFRLADGDTPQLDTDLGTADDAMTTGGKLAREEIA